MASPFWMFSFTSNYEISSMPKAPTIQNEIVFLGIAPLSTAE